MEIYTRQKLSTLFWRFFWSKNGESSCLHRSKVDIIADILQAARLGAQRKHIWCTDATSAFSNCKLIRIFFSTENF